MFQNLANFRFININLRSILGIAQKFVLFKDDRRHFEFSICTKCSIFPLDETWLSARLFMPGKKITFEFMRTQDSFQEQFAIRIKHDLMYF